MTAYDWLAALALGFRNVQLRRYATRELLYRLE